MITTPRRLCLGYVAECASAHFDVKGVKYLHICGQTKSYQKGCMGAFTRRLQPIDHIYVDGISISLHNHEWT